MKKRASCSWNYRRTRPGAFLSLIRCVRLSGGFQCNFSRTQTERRYNTTASLLSWESNIKINESHFHSPLSVCVLFHALVEMLMLFSCMYMMASDTLTEMESAASSMLNGPSNFSETWYRASETKKKRERYRERWRLLRLQALTLVLDAKYCPPEGGMETFRLIS